MVFLSLMRAQLCFQTEIDGLTGRVKYDNMGRRSYFSLDLIELTLTGLEPVSVLQTF